MSQPTFLPNHPRQGINTYCILGHGIDLIDSPEQIVPPGCIYVTITKCGLYSRDLPKIYRAFVDPLILPALAYPEHPVFHELLNHYFVNDKTHGDAGIRIHLPGHTYVDNRITLDADTLTERFKSGIYKLGETPPMRIGKSISEPDTPQNPPINKYEGSLQHPDPSKPNNGLVGNISEMMSQYPGVWYNFACRIVPEHVPPRKVNLIRHRSNIQQPVGLEHVTLAGKPVPPSLAQRGYEFNQTFYDWERNHIGNIERRQRWYDIISEQYGSDSYGMNVYRAPMMVGPSPPQGYLDSTFFIRSFFISNSLFPSMSNQNSYYNINLIRFKPIVRIPTMPLLGGRRYTLRQRKMNKKKSKIHPKRMRHTCKK